MDDTIDKAIQVCLKKLKLNPQDWNARTFLGRCYLKKGMLQEARKEFEEAVKTVSDNKVIFKLLADIYKKEGRTKEAKWIYRIFSAMDLDGSETDRPLRTLKTEEPAKKEAISDVKEEKPTKITQEAKEPVTKEKTAKRKEKDIYNDDSRYLFKTGLYG
jgi:tetratricopeptide (TPR) repeat protein